jgi:colicin import membrane protein
MPCSRERRPPKAKRLRNDDIPAAKSLRRRPKQKSSHGTRTAAATVLDTSQREGRSNFAEAWQKTPAAAAEAERRADVKEQRQTEKEQQQQEKAAKAAAAAKKKAENEAEAAAKKAVAAANKVEAAAKKAKTIHVDGLPASDRCGWSEQESNRCPKKEP